jgi:hypothetical protein
MTDDTGNLARVRSGRSRHGSAQRDSAGHRLLSVGRRYRVCLEPQVKAEAAYAGVQVSSKHWRLQAPATKQFQGLAEICCKSFFLAI